MLPAPYLKGTHPATAYTACVGRHKESHNSVPTKMPQPCAISSERARLTERHPRRKLASFDGTAVVVTPHTTLTSS